MSSGESPPHPPPPPPDDSGTLPSHEPSDDSMAGSDDDWAENSVPWNPELPVFEPSHNLLLDAGPWTVPYADFTPPPSPFALEMRAESIEQLVGGDALRRGESERIEAGRSEDNSDVVAGRDRVRVQGTLHEHTGHGLGEQVAHLDTTVDGRLDVHTGNEDTVLLAGHMKDVWDGGTAIVAAMTDDLVAGGGVRVTAPLDLWVHGLMGVEERIGTCTADAVLMELGATHYEREYGPGVHAAGLAVYNGSLYLSNRNSFRPLMRVSSGVRNLIAGGGSGGAGDGAGDGAGGAPDASPPPAPAAAGAGTEAVSETFSAATGNARSVDAVVEAGARSDNLTGTRHISNATDAVRSEDLAAMNQAPAAQLDDLRDSLRPAGDETGGRAGTGSPYNAGSDWRVPQEGVERSDTQMEFLDEFLHNFNTMLDDRSRDTSLFAPAGDLSELNHSADSAEQLAALQRGDVDTASVQSIGSPIPGGTDDLHHASEIPHAPTSVPGGDETPLGPARFEAFESVPSPDIVEPPGIPPDRGWATNYDELVAKLMKYRLACEWYPVTEYQRAVESVDSTVRETYRYFAGNAVDVNQFIGPEGTRAAYGLLVELASQAGEAGDAQRAEAIRDALKVVDQFIYENATNLANRANDFDGTSAWMAEYRRIDPAIDDVKLADWIQDQIDALGLGFVDPTVEEGFDAFRLGGFKAAYFTEMMQEVSRGWDPTFHSRFEMAYLIQVGEFEHARLADEMHVRLLEAMANPEMHRAGSVPAHVSQDLADLRLYDRSGHFVHVPGYAYVPVPNSSRVDDVHGAVHAAGVAGSVPEIPRSASAGSLYSSQVTTPPDPFVRVTDSESDLRFGSLVTDEPHRRASLGYLGGGSVPATPVVGAAPRLDANAASLPVLDDAFRLTSQVTTPPDPFVRMTDSDSAFDLRFGSLVTDEPHSRASLDYSGGGSVPATSVVGAAPRLDANASSWPGLEDAFRLTDDLEFLPGSQRVGEPLSDVPHGLESYLATDFGTFRRIDDAPADAPDEIRPRTGSSSEWEGGRSGTSSGQGGIGFGRPEAEGERPPGWQLGETPGFGGADAKPQDRGYDLSFLEWGVQNVMSEGDLSLPDGGIDNLPRRYREAIRTGEIERRIRPALGAVLPLFDAPRPGRGGRDRPV